MHFLKLIVGALSVLQTTTALKVSCKTEDNRDVDWYYLYKLPRHHSNAIDSDIGGLRYAYHTSESSSANWKLSNVLINETNSFPGRTLDHLINDKDVLFIAYNDQAPSQVDFEFGHTKGVVATDGVHGIWLIHSVPRFPSFPLTNYSYPDSGKNYGQSFLCITFNATTQMNTVGTQLLFNEPNVYFSRIPPELANKYPELMKVIARNWRLAPPFNSLVRLRSLNGTTFESFAKGRKFNKELYEDWIAPTFATDLLVETWRNSAGKLPSNCTRAQRVYNVGIITDDELAFSFKYTSDHSKWAVAHPAMSNWICVGDINRDEHQLVRGGGSVCQLNVRVANTYRSVIGSVERC